MNQESSVELRNGFCIYINFIFQGTRDFLSNGR